MRRLEVGLQRFIGFFRVVELIGLLGFVGVCRGFTAWYLNPKSMWTKCVWSILLISFGLLCYLLIGFIVLLSGCRVYRISRVDWACKIIGCRAFRFVGLVGLRVWDLGFIGFLGLIPEPQKYVEYWPFGLVYVCWAIVLPTYRVDRVF